MRRTQLDRHNLGLTVFAMAAAVLLAIAPASAQQPEEALYRAIEPIIKTAYDEAVQADTTRRSYDRHVAEFKRAQAQYTGQVPGNWADHIDADDWLKMFYYNEASIGVSCALGAGLDAQELGKNQNDVIQSKFLPCVSRGVQQMTAFFQTDNLLVTYNQGKFSTECEPKARLVAREHSLPPYSFLQPKNPDSLRLMQFGVYLKCIVDRMGINPDVIGVDSSLLD